MAEVEIDVLTKPPIDWIPTTVIGLLTMIINGLILKKEFTNRKSREIIFPTPILRISPILCMISGLLFAFIIFASHFNGLCYIGNQISYILTSLQSVCMGYYQLSRLYYSFSQNQVYSNKGYPNCLFIIMYLIGLLIIIAMIVGVCFKEISLFCGINNKYQYVNKVLDDNKEEEAIGATEIIGVGGGVYILWDLITLLLYIIKVISFKKYIYNKAENIAIYNRIMSILHRILILTVIYEVMFVLMLIVGISDIHHILFEFFGGLLSITISHQIFLMQQHNNSEYKTFLKLLYQFKIYNICCCCFKSVIINEIETDSDKTNLEKNIDDNKNKKIDDTLYETQDNSVKNDHSNVQELSIETMTQNQKV